MKNIYLLFCLISSPITANAVEDHPCKSPYSGTAIELTRVMENKLNINTETIVEKETKTSLISNEKINPTLTNQYANEDYQEDPQKGLPLSTYQEIYSEHDVRNLIIKFTFKNNKRKENVFLVSTLANNSECSIRFNGYIIVKREF